MGYGGLELEYVVRPYQVAHISFGVLVGAGGLAWDPVGWGRHDDDDIDAFFITEPSLNLLFNVTKHLRIGFGASYRFIQDVELVTLENDEISGAAGVFTIKLGGF